MFRPWFFKQAGHRSGTGRQVPAGKGRSRTTGRRLVIEPLEQRALLNVGPLVLPALADASALYGPAAAAKSVAVAKFSLYLRPSVQAGEPVTVQITALDARSFPVTDYTGTASLSSSDPAAVIVGDPGSTPPTVTFHQGQASVDVTFGTAGPQTLTVALPGNTPVTVTFRQGFASFQVLVRPRPSAMPSIDLASGGI